MDWLRNFSRICLRKPQENLPLPLKDPKKRWKASEWEKREKRGAKKKCTEFFSWETSGYFGYVLQNDFVEKIGSTKRILKKCVVGNSAKTFLGWWVYLTRTQRLLKWPINKGTKLGHDLNNLHHTGSWDSLLIGFCSFELTVLNETFCQGRPKPKQKPRCVSGRSDGVSQSMSEPRLHPGGVLSKFTIYESFDTWSSLIQLWIATFIYQYWNAKEWRNLTHFHGCGPVKIHPGCNWTPKIDLWYLAMLQTWPIWEVSLSDPQRSGIKLGYFESPARCFFVQGQHTDTRNTCNGNVFLPSVKKDKSVCPEAKPEADADLEATTVTMEHQRCEPCYLIDAGALEVLAAWSADSFVTMNSKSKRSTDCISSFAHAPVQALQWCWRSGILQPVY